MLTHGANSAAPSLQPPAEVNIAQYGAHIDPGTFPKPTQEDTSTITLAKHTIYPRAHKQAR